MFGWFRRVLTGVWHYFDSLSRLDELERRQTELELEWDQVMDKVGAMMKRHAKRMVDATHAVEGEVPSRTDLRLDRAARKAALRERRLHGGVNHGAS